MSDKCHETLMSRIVNKNGVLWSQACMRIVIGNRQLAINNWSLADGNGKKNIGNWTDQCVCFVSGQS